MTITQSEQPSKAKACPILIPLGRLSTGEILLGTSPIKDSAFPGLIPLEAGGLTDLMPLFSSHVQDSSGSQCKAAGSFSDKKVALHLDPSMLTPIKIYGDSGGEHRLVKQVYKIQPSQINSCKIEGNIRLAEELFEKVLKDEHSLKLFIKKLPKTDLHLHLDGSIQGNQLLQAAVANNLFFRVLEGQFEFGSEDELNSTAPKVSNRSNLDGRVRSAKELERDSLLREKFYGIVSMLGAKHRTSGEGSSFGGHVHFFGAFNTLESIAKHITLKDKLTLLLRNTVDHVRYLEPSIWFEKEEVPQSFVDKFNTLISIDSIENVLTVEKVQELMQDKALQKWVRNYVDKAKLDLEACKEVTDSKLLEKGFNKSNLFDISNPTVVRFIIDNDRTIGCLATVFAHFVGSMTLEMKDDRVVGSGFAGEEHNYYASEYYDQHMHIIKTLKDCFPGAKLSLHAGELNLVLAKTQEPLQTNVRKAIMAGADRIGHAVSATDDENSLQLFSLMNERDVHVECCLTSNENILGITNGSHSISWFISKGISYSLCTDDQGVNNSSPTQEMILAATRYNTSKDHTIKKGWNFGYREIKRSVLNSARQTFLPGPSIYKKPGADGRLQFQDVFVGGDSPFNGLREQLKCYLNSLITEGIPDLFEAFIKRGTSGILSILTSAQQDYFSNSEKAQMELEIEKEFIYFETVEVPELYESLS